MSLVGPRPEMPWLVDRYEPWQRKRFAVPQGITGWWQVNGRSDKPMHLNTDDDLYYVYNYSLWLDLRILLMTPVGRPARPRRFLTVGPALSASAGLPEMPASVVWTVRAGSSDRQLAPEEPITAMRPAGSRAAGRRLPLAIGHAQQRVRRGLEFDLRCSRSACQLLRNWLRKRALAGGF